jgi:hypothetical protein
VKIFVGTLKTIENEFEECVASIERQTHQNFEHFVFEDLSNKEAHDTLYRSFMERSDEFDLMVKVDADMVIENKELLAGIVDRFEQHPQLKDLVIAVHDFFSDRLIWGMHAYRNTMTWQTNDENLFVDRASVEPEAKMQDDEDLAPAAIHCKNPSPFQAFHYGIHKAMKMIQPGRWPKNLHQSRFHWTNVQETRDHFIESGDRRIGFAVLGAEFGLREDVQPKHISYSNLYLRERFEQFVDLKTEELRTEIDRHAPFSFLPNWLRRRALIYRDRVKHMLSGTAEVQE